MTTVLISPSDPVMVAGMVKAPAPGTHNRSEHVEAGPVAGSTVTASPALLGAALAGLLGLTACAAHDDERRRAGASVTVERLDPDMTEQEFIDACADAMGTFESHAHCGGMNSCEGFSYDVTTGVYSEHTCRGLNTCTGWSCVLHEATG